MYFVYYVELKTSNTILYQERQDKRRFAINRENQARGSLALDSQQRVQKRKGRKATWRASRTSSLENGRFRLPSFEKRFHGGDSVRVYPRISQVPLKRANSKSFYETFDKIKKARRPVLFVPAETRVREVHEDFYVGVLSTLKSSRTSRNSGT
ncbi:hypothetical protein V1477_009525 [Vespula maculifrons]|uniref:Uncharacterized protein n=1 Tax=Vespula maculifrons TaxID=7453 RepID=A0ABD2CA10_VESMC